MRQNDSKLRVVSFRNLKAMCKRASGMSHRFSAEIGAARCILTYSNPDEYGSETPYSVALPLLRTNEKDNPDVLFHTTSERGGRDSYDKEACFQRIESEIFSAPQLWWSAEGNWRTTYEVLLERDQKHESISAGPYTVKKDSDGTYRVTNGYGYLVALAMCAADAALLHRALWTASAEQGIPNARVEESTP